MEILRSAMEKLHAAGLPALAIYAFDATWELALVLRDGIARALGTSYLVLRDFWAFRIEPGQSGWAPHRGVDEPLDRDLPQTINVWLALSGASAVQSCMHFVPLDRDAAFLRGDLADLGAAAKVQVPVPCAAGTALFWNANMLHWGGPCLEDAPGPRVSATFTLARADTVPGGGSFDGHDLGGWERLDAIAEQVLTYAAMASVAPDLIEWATANRRLRIKMHQR